jgi:hypothetical protein
MKNPYALILLVAATTAYGQINNPPTSVNIVDHGAGRAADNGQLRGQPRPLASERPTR